jgi:hypothetical protein
LKAKLLLDDPTLNSPYGVLGIMRDVYARKAFLESDLCKWIERQRMSYWTCAESRPVEHVSSMGRGTSVESYIAVNLNISDEQFTLLKMKLDDPTRLTVVSDA